MVKSGAVGDTSGKTYDQVGNRIYYILRYIYEFDKLI
jgi:hypothetical protein